MEMDPRSGFCKSNSTFYSKLEPVRLPSNHSLDLTTFISSQPHPHSGRPSFIDARTGRRLSSPQVWSAVESVAACLSHDLGIRKGHVVLVLSPNSLLFPIACLSVMSLGAIITTANPLNTSREIAHQISDTGAALVFTIPELLYKLPRSQPPVAVLMRDISPSKHPGLRIHPSTLEDMMTAEPPPALIKERVTQDDTAVLLYSSGTTGESKGVVSSHANLIALVGVISARFKTHEQDQVYVATIPMFHTFGFATFVITLLAKGCTVVVLPKFGMEEMLSAVHEYKATYLPVVPPILVAMADNFGAMKGRYDLRSLRYVLSGGAPLSAVAMEAFEKSYPQVTILQGYAMTESNGAGACMTGTSEEESRRLRRGTSGLLTPSTEAKIVDPDTREELSVNRTGELWLRCPSIMKGYFGNETATLSALTPDGWLKTGDLCYIDDDGFLFVVDRLKEVIKYKGYQVPPAELESVLHEHPEITDAAVIPFPDDKVGQYPMAYVVRRNGSSLSDCEVMDFVAKQVAPYKKIRRVAFVESIPKNSSGKILRKDLIKLTASKL